jgi:hypothetical protein
MALPDKSLISQLDDITLKGIDQSVVNWFARDYPVTINGQKIPVIYASQEIWARAQKDKGFKDEAGVLILPLISVRRTVPDTIKERYVPEGDESNMTVSRRIATTPISQNDRQPSSMANKVVEPGYGKTKDEVIYEVLQVPFPSMVNLDYEITVWTSYMTHQNLEQENIFKQFKGGRQYFKVDDYYFFGINKPGAQDQSNLDDFSDKEKIIKYKFQLLIYAYFIDKNKIKSYRTSGNQKITVTEKSYLI